MKPYYHVDKMQAIEGSGVDDQHRKISGYRDLDQAEIDLMNQIKELAEQCGQMVEFLRGDANTYASVDQRWVAIGATDLQTGFMALVRAVAQPTTF
jgi:hypothetical protein